MLVNRDMVLSYELTIEEILELVKKDILSVKKNRSYKTDRIHIVTKVYT